MTTTAIGGRLDLSARTVAPAATRAPSRDWSEALGQARPKDPEAKAMAALREMAAELAALPPGQRKKITRRIKIDKKHTLKLTMHADGRIEQKVERKKSFLEKGLGLLGKAAPILSLAAPFIPALAPVAGLLKGAEAIGALAKGDLGGALDIVPGFANLRSGVGSFAAGDPLGGMGDLLRASGAMFSR